jgi:hypothetical protein
MRLHHMILTSVAIGTLVLTTQTGLRKDSLQTRQYHRAMQFLEKKNTHPIFTGLIRTGCCGAILTCIPLIRQMRG